MSDLSVAIHTPNVGLHGSAVADTVEGVVRNVFNEVNDV
jgi:hypothetical protein